MVIRNISLRGHVANPLLGAPASVPAGDAAIVTAGRAFTPLVVALMLASCAPAKPAPPPNQPPPLPVVTEATVYPSLGTLPTPRVTATPDNGSPVVCAVDPSDNRFHCELPPGTQHGDLDITADGFLPYHQHVDFPLTSDLTIAANRVELPRLGVWAGRFFGYKNTIPVMVLEAVEFDLFEQFLHGVDVTPVLDQLHRDGFNMLRVFTAFAICPDGHSTVDGTACQKIGRLIPAETASLYDAVVPFLDLASRYELHVEFVAWTGPYVGVLAGDDAKIQHYNKLCVAVSQRTNGLISLINEADNGPNRGAPLQGVQPCPGVFVSHGSNSGDADPVLPVWGYTELHVGPGLSGEWQRRPGHDAMDLATKFGAPVAITEMMRTDSETSPNAVQHYYDTGRASALLNGWIVCHSPEGKAGVLWQADTEAKCKALADGARSMDLSCQDGPYSNNESAVGVIREYHRGSRPECVAPVH